MKKAAVLFLCLATVLCLFGCGKNTPDETTTEAAAPTGVNYSEVATDSFNAENEDATGETVAQPNGGYNEYFKEDGNVKTVYEYDDKGEISQYVQYERNDNDQAVAVIKYGKDKKYTSATQYEYNPDGTVYRIYYYDAEGKLEYYEQDYYDKDGNRAGVQYNPDGTVLNDPYNIAADVKEGKEIVITTKAAEATKATTAKAAESTTKKNG